MWKHETAIIDEGALIGAETKIWHWSHICGRNVEIGTHCSFGQNVYVGNDVKIGNNVRVQNNVSIYDRVILEDNVFCGPSMVFTNVINPRAHISRKTEFKVTLVKTGATIGANATIVCGVEIGRYAFIAAGAVVTHKIEDFALMMGVPARHSGWVCQCGVKLPVQLGERQKNCTCLTCGSIYKIDGQKCCEVELKTI
jgi:UDP-2-acetamido-3-amino-2,3-dideoxy-glucuronate N-acetyltransferase